MDLPQRKPNRIEAYDYSLNGAYFVTVCTRDREKIFWDIVGADIIRPQNVPLSSIGEIAVQAICQIPKHYENVFVDKYCVMPDHVHLILRIELEMDGRIISAPTVSTVVGSMKRWTSRQIGRPIWQKSYYDHVIRNQKDYDEIWQYIDNNPRKWLIQNGGDE
ncbi:MAG: transposase [Oscillospiraceae bacterium]|nr:transposase [Oscillospiraceae bacterium]